MSKGTEFAEKVNQIFDLTWDLIRLKQSITHDDELDAVKHGVGAILLHRETMVTEIEAIEVTNDGFSLMTDRMKFLVTRIERRGN